MEYFQGKTYSLIPGYSDPVKAIKNKTNTCFKHNVKISLGDKKSFFIITEIYLYKLIVNSKLPYANKFEKLVFDEILPSIRAKNKVKSIEEKITDTSLLIPITIIAKDYGMSGLKINKILNALKVQYRLGNK